MQVYACADDGRTWTFTYVVLDPATRDAVVVDRIPNRNGMPWRTSTESLNRVPAFIDGRDLKVHWVLDTHVHSDHISDAGESKNQLKAPMAIGARIRRAQEIFNKTFNLGRGFPTEATAGGSIAPARRWRPAPGRQSGGHSPAHPRPHTGLLYLPDR